MATACPPLTIGVPLRPPLLALVAAVVVAGGCGSGPGGPVRTLDFSEHASRLPETPGSYEWWNFYAEDGSGDFSVSAIFMPANLFDVEYRRAVRAWQADPAAIPPPRPGDYWLLQLNVSVEGAKVFTNLRRWPDHSAEFSRTRPYGRIGESSFEAEASPSGTLFRVHLDAPDVTNRLRLRGDLEFTSEAPGFTPAGGMYGAMPGGPEHAWQLPLGLPRCSGSLRVVRRDGGDELAERAISGRGYIDHMWGEGLLGDRLASWHFGTFDRGAAGRLVYVWLEPLAGQAAASGFVFVIGPGGLPRTFAIESQTALERTTGSMGLDYASAYRLDLAEGGSLTARLLPTPGEDWPFQVSGPATLEAAIPGVVEERLGGVAEYLLQAGIDDPDYATLFDLIDQMEWLE